MLRMPTTSSEPTSDPASDRKAQPKAAEVLRTLAGVCDDQELGSLAARLADLAELTRWDMAEVEQSISGLERGERLVQQAAHLLLDLGGKRLRPLCVALASRMGEGFGPAARECATAVELVHCATLLHDDVVDDSPTRRGAPAARTVYGNAASIFGGDWLLIESLQRVRKAGVPDTLARLLDIIDEMIVAESHQLEARGRIDTTAETYFNIVEGKTAALFRWAMFAGARAGGLGLEQAHALETYGRHLGVAFQLVDDLLDYVGDAEKTGKLLFTDLREGKMTHPLLVARDRDPQVAVQLEAVRDSDGAHGTAELLAALRASGATDETRRLAQEHAALAVAQLADFPASPAKTALLTVADACVSRER